MPLMMCPNCQTEMKEINRQGVQIDMCASCHGVWLDRGELNKLMELNRQEMSESYAQQPAAVASAPRQQQQHYAPQHHDPRYYKRKSKLESLFDIFD